MECPHCLVQIHPNVSDVEVVKDTSRKEAWSISYFCCPNPSCSEYSFLLTRAKYRAVPSRIITDDPYGFFWAYPKNRSRKPLPHEVPGDIARDYREAVEVLPYSAQASAALSRRILQHLLRDYAGTKKKDLADQIQEVLDGGKLPTHLAEDIDAIRNIGNFSAHTQKSNATGEILPVETGEAEWSLEVLEALFDFYFVQPAKSAARRAELNSKLNMAGKPEMKQP